MQKARVKGASTKKADVSFSIVVEFDFPFSPIWIHAISEANKSKIGNISGIKCKWCIHDEEIIAWKVWESKKFFWLSKRNFNRSSCDKYANHFASFIIRESIGSVALSGGAEGREGVGHAQSITKNQRQRKNFFVFLWKNFCVIMWEKAWQTPPISEKTLDCISGKTVGGYYSHSPLQTCTYQYIRSQRRRWSSIYRSSPPFTPNRGTLCKNQPKKNKKKPEPVFEKPIFNHQKRCNSWWCP